MEAPWLTPPKKFKRVHSAGKAMASIFLDNQGVIMIDYLEQGRILCRQLRRLRLEVARKMEGNPSPSALLLQDNAPAHTSQVAMTAATECGLKSFLIPNILLLWLHLTSICFQN